MKVVAVGTLDEAWAVLCDTRTVMLDGDAVLLGVRYEIPQWMNYPLLVGGWSRAADEFELQFNRLRLLIDD